MSFFKYSSTLFLYVNSFSFFTLCSSAVQQQGAQKEDRADDEIYRQLPQIPGKRQGLIGRRCDQYTDAQPEQAGDRKGPGRGAAEPHRADPEKGLAAFPAAADQEYAENDQWDPGDRQIHQKDGSKGDIGIPGVGEQAQRELEQDCQPQRS